MRHVMAWGAGLVWLTLFMVVCGAGREFNQSELTEIKSIYADPDYGFSVTIPDGLVARRMKAPAPNHGFSADLPDGSQLWVDASYDALLLGSADKAAMEAGRAWLTAPQMRIVNRRATTLAGNQASDIVIKRGPAGSGVNYVRLIVAFRAVFGGVGIVYTIGLKESSVGPNSEGVLSEVVKSFHVMPLQ